MSTVAVFAHQRLVRRNDPASGADPRAWVARVLEQPSHIFHIVFTRSAIRWRRLARNDPDPTLNQLRLTALGLEVASWVLFVMILVRWLVQ